jgi:hypothetical protein
MTDPARISIPFRSPDEPLIDTASACRRLPPAERASMRELVLNARVAGLKTAGKLLDLLGRMSTAERRTTLDHARASAGRRRGRRRRGQGQPERADPAAPRTAVPPHRTPPRRDLRRVGVREGFREHVFSPAIAEWVRKKNTAVSKLTPEDP